MFSAAKTSGPSGYNINNSLRFRRSATAYLNRTPASAGNRQVMTYSFWVKRGFVGSLTSDDYCPISAYTDASNLAVIYFNSSNSQSLDVFLKVAGTNYSVTTSQRFADPSAWYHIVIAIDTTQATASNRTKIYVNGSQVTAFSAASYVPQNSNLALNNNVAQYFGTQYISSSYFDGYLAEVNFIDGQALTPSSFGSTNATTGVWQPAKYTGTYGTNGFYLPFSNNTLSTYGGYFTGATQNLKVASNAAFAIGTGDFTVEMFYNPSSWGNQQRFMVQGVSGTTNIGFETDANNQLMVYINTTSVISYPWIPTTGTWHHIATVRKSGVLKLYIDGALVASASNTASIAANQVFVGGLDWASGYSANGYISNFRYTNTAVYDGSFTPPSSNLTNIPGTLLLTLQGSTIVDNSSYAWSITNNGSLPTAVVTPFTANITNDASGNNNSWTHNNINSSTPGTTYDAMTDVPTNTSATVANYCVANPLDKVSADSTSQGNLLVTVNGGAASGVRCNTVNFTSITGKWYWEGTVTADSVGRTMFSMKAEPCNISSGVSSLTWYWRSDGVTNLTGVGTFTTNDVIMFAYDSDTGKMWAGKNGTWLNSGVPASGTGQVTTLTALAAYALALSCDTGGAGTGAVAFNYGQRPFSYTPPTGFNRVNTYNLPTPTILQGNKYMDASLWTGDSTSPRAVVSTLNFKPDFVWTKVRSNTYSNTLYDSVRGGGQALFSDTTGAEQANYVNGYIQSFNSNGWTMQNGSSGGIVLNNSGQTYVAWQWQAGQGTTSSNTSGSITSTVSANTTAGFSIVTYTGTGANATVGHGLGVAPKMIFFKQRSGGTARAWQVYHVSMGNGGGAYLNQTNAYTADSTAFNNTSPTSSVFTIGSSVYPNQNASPYVAYCWAEIAGFSKAFSYTGNGSTDGPFTYLGFRPKFVLIKNTSTAGTSWVILDTTRNTYNIEDAILYPNVSNAEATFSSLDGLSNGFKIRNIDGSMNTNGNTYIGMAFAENPFKNALAR